MVCLGGACAGKVKGRSDEIKDELNDNDGRGSMMAVTNRDAKFKR